MGFEGFNPGTEEIKNISENKSSDSLNTLKNEIQNEIKDKTLQTEAQKELQEFIAKIKKNKEALVVQNSKLILNDLKQELQEDLKALNKLEDKFGQYPGFNTFKKFFINEVSDSDKEIIYDLIESGEFGKYVKRRLKGEMFPDVDKLKDFLSRMKRGGKIEKKSQDSDIKEIFDLEKQDKIKDLSIKELEYYDKKIDELKEFSTSNDIKILKKIKNDILKEIQLKEGEKFKKEGEKFKKEQEGIKKEQEGIKKEQEGIKKEQEGIKKEQEGIKKEQEGIKKEQEGIKENKIIFSKESKEFFDIVKEFSSVVEKHNLKGKIKELYDKFILKLGDLRDKDGNIKKEFIKNGEIITDKLKNEIIDFLLQGDNLKQVVQESIRSGHYREIRKFLVSLGASNLENGKKDEFLVKLSEVEKELNYNPLKTLSVVRQKEIENFVGEGNDYEIVGDKIITDGKEIDFSENPPKAYLVGKGGYKLETDMQKVEDTKEIIENRRELQEIKLELKSLKNSYKRKINLIKEIEKTPEEKRTKEQKEKYNELKREITEIKNKIKELVEKAEKIKKQFDKQKKLFDKKEQKKLLEKQEKQKKTLKFIHKIGLDLIDRNDMNKIFNQLNGKGVEGNNGVVVPRVNIDLGIGEKLNTKIDLKNGIFGYENSSEGIQDREKEVFVRLFNKILSGNPEKPISVNDAINDEKNYQVNKTIIENYRAKLYDGATFNIDEIIENLKKPVEKEEKTENK